MEIRLYIVMGKRNGGEIYAKLLALDLVLELQLLLISQESIWRGKLDMKCAKIRKTWHPPR